MRACAGARRAGCLAAAVWAALATPPARGWLESSMVLHMLAQLPLLALVGFYSGVLWQAAPGPAAVRILARVRSFKAGGTTGLVAASFVMVLWMLWGAAAYALVIVWRPMFGGTGNDESAAGP